MNKLFIGSLSVGLTFILQGFFAAPALAQQYQYQSQYQPQYYQQYGSTYPTYYNYPYNNYSYNNQYSNQYYQYPYYNNYGYNNQYCQPYNYGYGYSNSYYPNYQYPCNYGYGQLSVTGVSGPTQLTVGQGGLWSVTVSGGGGQLSYTATWGDEGTYGYSSVSAISTSGSLSHVYLRAGTYTPRFTVTDAWGRSVTASISVVVTGGCNYYYPWTCQNYQNYQQYPYQYPYSYPYVY